MKNDRWINKTFSKEYEHSDFCIEDILGKNMKILIPRYQRRFVWKEKNFKSLIEIIDFDSEAKKKIFLGMIISKKNDDDKINTRELIDGQQRITTIYLIVISFWINLLFITENMNSLKQKKDEIHNEDYEKIEETKKRINGLISLVETIIFANDFDNAKIIYQPNLKYQSDSESNAELKKIIEYTLKSKENYGFLKLNISNFFKKYKATINEEKIVNENIILNNIEKVNSSIGNLILEKTKINIYKFDCNINNIITYSKALEYFIKYITQEIEFINIDISNATTAMEIFERVNTTGEKLKTIDLIYNYIYKNINTHLSENEYKNENKKLISKLDKIKTNYSDPFLLRSIHNILNCFNIGKQISESRSYSAIVEFYENIIGCDNIKKINKIIDDIKEINETNNMYLSEVEFTPMLNFVYRMLKIFDFKMLYSQLIAKTMYWNKKTEEQKKIIENIFVNLFISQLTQITFSRKDTKLFIPILENSLQGIKSNSTISVLSNCLDEMKKNDMYIGIGKWMDLNELDKFSQINKASKKRALLILSYLLSEWNKNKNLKSYFSNDTAIKRTINWSKIEVEHILPRKHDKWTVQGYWNKNKEIIPQVIEIMGNKLILMSSINKKLSNDLFDYKKTKYKLISSSNELDEKDDENQYILANHETFTEIINNSKEWNKDDIIKRNDKMLRSFISNLNELFEFYK